jgi:negative regulator of sigma E activity
MSGFDLTSPVVLELRAARPRAPEALRERVLARGALEHKERFAFALPSRFTLRRVALVAVPACLAVAVGTAVIHGAFNAGSSQQRKAVPTTAEHTPPVPRHAGAGERKLAPSQSLARPTSLPPSKTRLQDYRASLTLRVDGLDDLSSSTQKAIRITRGLGGYVVSARYGAEKEGLSSLVVRVPIDHVQQAVARFSQLGKITAQDIHIRDLQARVNELGRRIDALRVRIAKIDDRLADPSLSSAERVRLELRRARLARTLHALTAQRAHTVRRAQFATVSLALTTHEAAIVKPHHQGPLGRALDDAGTILAKEAAWGLYALIVVGPLLVLAALAVLLVRTGRRYADRRLLESS